MKFSPANPTCILNHRVFQVDGVPAMHFEKIKWKSRKFIEKLLKSAKVGGGYVDKVSGKFW